MNKIRHEILGDIIFDHFWWKKKQSVVFFKKEVELEISIDGDQNAKFDPLQIIAFKEFFDNVENLLLDAEKAIYDYYQEVCLDYRDRLEDSADEFSPIVSTIEELGKLVQLQGVNFSKPFKKNTREVGLLLNCTWEPEHGLAVVFENEKIVEVGYQDIFL